MALSPNYGWAEPDNSSLVKNGAQDIRALGDAIDTSLWNVGFGQAGKNKIINGDMNIWQRGTSTTMTNNTHAFGPDRFRAYVTFSAGSASFAQQSFTAGTAPVAGYESQYFARLTCGSTSTYAEISQKIEDVRTFAGQPATLSFWAKSSAAIVFTPYLIQSFGSGGSSDVLVAGSNITLTTSWVRYTVPLTVPSIAGKTIGAGNNLIALLAYASGTLNSATIDIWGWQVEYGSKATPFETATGTIQGELAACQRYFIASLNGYGNAQNTTNAHINFSFPVVMRTTPTVATPAAAVTLFDPKVGNTTQSAPDASLNTSSSYGASVLMANFTGLTAANNYFFTGNTSIQFSAEL
jgi:hypothetical protein